MSEPFLTTTVPDMRVSVEVAWGADLTDLDGSGWTWDDITEHVVLSGGKSTSGTGIAIRLGRPDFSQETQTAEMTCRMDNRTGIYSEGGQSVHWPNVRRGTPVRVRVSPDGGDTWTLRFQGRANGFTPAWDEATGRWADVELSASGPLRRLNQGTGVMISAMKEGTLADSTVVAYLPCMDRQHSTFIAPAISDREGRFRVFDMDAAAMTDGVAGECASYAAIPSAGEILTLQEGGGVAWDVPPTTTAATFIAMFGNVAQIEPFTGSDLDNFNKFGGRQIGSVFNLFTSGAPAVKAWAVQYVGDGELRLTAYSSTAFTYGDSTVINRLLNAQLLDNVPYEIGLSLSQSGATTSYRFFRRELLNDAGIFWTGTVGSNTGGAVVSSIQIGAAGDSQGMATGHLTLRNAIVDEQYDKDWSLGYPGETVEARLTRLCESHGIALTVLDATVTRSASIVDTMGPQYYDTLTALLRECEITGQGFLFDGLGPGLTYVTKDYREVAAAAPILTLDAGAAQIMEPFTPVDDDQLTINHVDVTRRSGTDATHSDLTGPLGVDAIGDYSTSITPNTTTDDDLVGYAEWLVHVGTQSGYRYPTISFALETNADLIADWLACTPQSRVDVVNITDVRAQHPEHPIRLLLEGWSEEIDAFTWRVTANTSSSEPWNTVRLAAATGSTGDDICHLQTGGSQLNANYVSGTTISVKTITGPIWVTTAVDADSFPFDIDVGGVKATVTGIVNASSPQTFTLSAALPRAFTGSTTSGLGTPVKVWRPPVFGL